ncbi:ABC transporter ATP-binding protein/permease [Isoptericola sp. 4D.3]|uniref:ABC transporter ATP-binding protein/permease n=1 Tax=Isoptericola peretonis TaxID=2918523 RepID=A0ABT0J6I8_9MICO|nr:ABC transporter ATP-binding protein/permease [Isoptericola sp. 4D.3]
MVDSMAAAVENPPTETTVTDPPPERSGRERLRILLGFVRPHRRTLALGLALGLLATAMSLATPMVTKWVLDTLSTGASMGGPVAWLVALMIVGSVVGLFQWILLGRLAEDVVYEARSSIVTRYLRARVGAITSQPAGELVTRVTSDTLLLREATSNSLVSLVNGFISLVGTLVLMAVLDLTLLGSTVAAIVVVAVAMALLLPGIGKAQHRTQEAVGRLGGAVEGAVRAVRTVKASGAEERQGRTILGDAQEARKHAVTAVKTEAVAWTVSWGGIQLAIIVILGLGAWRVSQDLLAVSSLVAFLLYAFNIVGPISELTQAFTTLQSGLAAAERIREVETMELEEDDGAGRPDAGRREAAAHDAGADGPVLVLDAVTAGYAEGSPVVHGVSLEVPRRGHVALVGPSGAGKTTLLSLLLRFVEPTSGELRLDGVPYRELSHADVRSRFAYVEQETPVVPGTIRENLLFSRPDATDSEVRAVLEAVRLAADLDALPDGLDTSLVSSAVSGGQRQRIALARALLKEPDVLLLDEATSQVDGLTEAAIHDAIRAHTRRGAVVTVAHRLSTVLDADRILVMEGGRVRASGTHEELHASDELYRDLVAALRIAVDAESPAVATTA